MKFGVFSNRLIMTRTSFSHRFYLPIKIIMWIFELSIHFEKKYYSVINHAFMNFQEGYLKFET